MYKEERGKHGTGADGRDCQLSAARTSDFEVGDGGMVMPHGSMDGQPADKVAAGWSQGAHGANGNGNSGRPPFGFSEWPEIRRSPSIGIPKGSVVSLLRYKLWMTNI